jgi:hypothetical protein
LPLERCADQQHGCRAYQRWNPFMNLQVLSLASIATTLVLPVICTPKEIDSQAAIGGNGTF